MQVCSVCKEEKPFTEYHRHKSHRTGYSVTCKSCSLKRSSEWQIANRERINARRRERRLERPEHYAAIEREKHKKWYWKDPEKAKSYIKEYNQKHPEIYRKKNALRRVRTVENGVFFISEKEIKSLLSTPCANCGTLDNITLDHVIPISKGGRHSVGNLQSLCKPCNSSKGTKTMTEWLKSKNLLGVK